MVVISTGRSATCPGIAHTYATVVSFTRPQALGDERGITYLIAWGSTILSFTQKRTHAERQRRLGGRGNAAFTPAETPRRAPEAASATGR